MPHSYLVIYISTEAKIKVAAINGTLEEELRFRKISGTNLISKLKLNYMSTRYYLNQQDSKLAFIKSDIGKWERVAKTLPNKAFARRRIC